MKLRISGGTVSHPMFFAHGEYEAGVDARLSPCPFCGEQDDLSCENTHTPYYEVKCEQCGAVGPGGQIEPEAYDGAAFRCVETLKRVHRSSFDAAICAWNGRTQEPRHD
jgi:hypothetical protein